jgi:hypothetical protein
MRLLPSDGKCQLRGATLERAIRSDREKGLIPFYVSTVIDWIIIMSRLNASYLFWRFVYKIVRQQIKRSFHLLPSLQIENVLIGQDMEVEGYNMLEIGVTTTKTVLSSQCDGHSDTTIWLKIVFTPSFELCFFNTYRYIHKESPTIDGWRATKGSLQFIAGTVWIYRKWDANWNRLRLCSRICYTKWLKRVWQIID